MLRNEELREILAPPSVSVERAAHALGISRSFAYEAVARGDIESVRIGSKIFVLTAPLRTKFKIEA